MLLSIEEFKRKSKIEPGIIDSWIKLHGMPAYQGKTGMVIEITEVVPWIERFRKQPKSMQWLLRELKVKATPSVAAAWPDSRDEDESREPQRFDPMNKNHVMLRKELAAAQMNETRRLKMRGELVPRDRLIRERAAFAHAIRQAIRALPAAISSNLVNLVDKQEIEEIMLREIDEMLNDLADSPQVIAGPTPQEREELEGYENLDELDAEQDDEVEEIEVEEEA